MSLVIDYISKLLAQIRTLDDDFIILAVLAVAGIIMIDAFSRFARIKAEQIGLSKDSRTLAIDGGKTLTQKEYISEAQGLAGRPDAVISEDGFLIPVERKPFARKIRDRYIAQLLVYMRLIEEFEGKRPPYGYLVLGTKCRQVKIENTEARQKWLSGILQEMQAVLGGGNARPSPSPKKCQKCDVRNNCRFAPNVSAIRNSQQLLAIRSRIG